MSFLYNLFRFSIDTLSIYQKFSFEYSNEVYLNIFIEINLLYSC